MSLSKCPSKREAWTDSSRTTSPLCVVAVQNNEVSKGHSYMDRSINRLAQGVEAGVASVVDLDVLNALGGDQVLRASDGLFGLEGMALASKLAGDPSAPDEAVAKIPDLAPRLGDPHGERPCHRPSLSFRSFLMSITALGGPNSKHVVMPPDPLLEEVR